MAEENASANQPRSAFADHWPMATSVSGVAYITLGLVLTQFSVTLGALQLILSIALLSAGLWQLLTAIGCWIKGETFGLWVFGTFSSFWLAYGFLGIGINTGILLFPETENLGHVFAIFTIPYIFVFIFWTLASLTMPFTYFLFFLVFAGNLCVLAAALYDNFDPTLTRAAGAGIVFCGVEIIYVSADMALRDVGLIRKLPQGPSMISVFQTLGLMPRPSPVSAS